MSGPTKKKYEQYLNGIKGDKYGSRMRRNDPVQFDVGYQEYCRVH